jgi:endoglucanase
MMSKAVISRRQWSSKITTLSAVSLALTVALISCNTTSKNTDANGTRKPWRSANANAAAVRTGYLSDQDWVVATSSYGPISKNLAYGEGNPNDRKNITLAGTSYDKGLGTHADSMMNFKLAPDCASFKASIGLDDQVRWQSEHGNVLFQVYGDNDKLLFDSKSVDRDTPTIDVDVDVRGQASLRLVVDQNKNTTEGDQSDWYDQADWANARVECAGTSTPPSASSIKIQFEDFKQGGEGVGYHDNDTINQGGLYRPNEGVDIDQRGNPEGYDVGWSGTGEWLKYDLNVAAGTYALNIRTATFRTDQHLDISVDNTKVLTANLPYTGSFDSLQAVNVGSIKLSAGAHVFKVAYADSNPAMNLDWMEFVPTNTTPPNPSPSPTPPPASSFPYSKGVNLAGADFGENALPGVFGTHYTYPNQGEVDYFNAKGMNIYRLPFRWERLQRSLNADFDANETARLDGFVNATTAKGQIVVLDPHNYARYNGALIGSSSVPYTAFADFWRRLAERYKNNPKVVFGLVNEPHDMPTAQWVNAANAAIAAIRATGSSNTIFVPGNRWTGAWTWFTQDENGASNAQAMLSITDSGNNMVFEVHQYLDSDGSGTHDECVSASIGSERLQAFTGWLRDHNRKGFVGELASGLNAMCDTALEDMVGYIESNTDVLRGWTYWAAGPWWGNVNSLEPKGNQDARQMGILQKFLTPR